MERKTRRRFVTLAGTALAAGLAGCTGSAAPQVDTSSPTATEHHEEDGHHDETDGHHKETDAHAEDSHETGHETGHEHQSLDGPSPSATVRMTTNDSGTHFEPHVVWVEQGGTITFVNESGSHTATAYAGANDRPRRIPEGAEAFDSGLLSADGAEFEVTLDTPGVYDYFCLPHEATGMIGSVIVGEPDAHDQPGLAEPQDSLPAAARKKIRSLNEQVNEALGHTH